MKKLKNYLLKSVNIKGLNEYGEWYIIEGGIICEEQYSNKYFADRKGIFEVYTEIREEYKAKAKKNPNNFSMDDFYKEIRLEIETLSFFSEDDLKTIKRVFDLRYVDKKVETIYSREQHYGGAEEGGWYYHNLYLTMYTKKTFPKNYWLGTDKFGEGYVLETEYYTGEHEKTAKEFYH